MVRRLIALVAGLTLAAACEVAGPVSLFPDQAQSPDVVMGGVADERVRTDVMLDQPELPVDIVAEDRLEFEALAPDTGGPQCEPGEGCFLDPCESSQSCLSGWCVGHMGEDVCTIECQTECPSGWSCEQVPGTAPDVVWLCVSRHANLCLPCATGADCKGAAGVDDVCVDYGSEGSFCGGSCQVDEDCPWGFSCAEVQTVDGIATTQCLADSGVCPCTSKSVELALWTPCENSNEFGLCQGKRLCTEDGLTTCDALLPAPEICNGLDDDCDADTDEGEVVDDVYLSLCDDGNPCTTDKCIGGSGCEYVALTEGECMDGNPCTVADHCGDGVCVGDPVECDDDNPCTDNLCTETGGCEYPPAAGECDDGDPCTLGDHCAQGQCLGESVNCQCQQDADCAALEDGDLCNGTLYCNLEAVPYLCAVVPDTEVSCDPPEGPDAPCFAAQCDPATGKCSNIPANQGKPCEDGDLCTLGDTCADGLCAAGLPANCNDGNPCTDDACETVTGCTHVDNSDPCSDGDVCTTGDACKAGACTPGEPLSCDDGDVCNGSETCDSALGCQAGVPLKCNDNDECNGMEWCDPAQGCQPGAAPLCDDGNLCTDDSCTADGGCLHAPNDLPCNDFNECSLSDKCSAGACKPGPSLNCNDDEICTTDACDPQQGCVHNLNTLPCNDDDVCTINDHCQLGTCTGSVQLNCDDGNPCTADSCQAGAGCQFTPTQGDCSDGTECTTGDHCVNGFCIAAGFMDCDDANLCTNDACDPATGCTHVANELPCDDADACTTVDLCAAKECVGFGSPDCDDSNLCTDDSCDPAVGCVHAANELDCNDGNKCTPFDKCVDKQCVGTGAVDCDDGNVCTDESCQPQEGCVFVHNAEPCSDNNVCTVTDICADGQCQPGDALDCDDQVDCTIDSCDEVDGCLHVMGDDCCGNGILDPGEQCDDGNQNNGDYCSNNCEFDGAVFSQYSKEGRTVYIFKSVSETPLANYENFCESLGLEWFVPKTQSDAQLLITNCYNLDNFHTWIITKNNTDGNNFGGFNVSAVTNGGSCGGGCSDSGFSAIRKWSSSYCDPEEYGKTECWDADHIYDWLVCED